MPPDLYSPAHPQSIGEVLDSAFRIFKLTLLKCLPYGVLTMVASELPNIYDIASGRPLLPFGGGDRRWWVFFVAGGALSLMLWGALLLRQRTMIRGQPVGARNEIGAALRQLPMILAFTLLGTAALGLGLCLLLVPGIYLLVALSLGLPAVVLSGRGPIAAIGYSLKLTRGNWWRAFSVYAVGASSFVVFMLLSLILVGVLLPFAGAADVAVVTAFSTVVVVILGAIGMPFFCALILAIYADLQSRQEGTG